MLLYKGAKKALKDRTDETPYSLAVRVGAPQVRGYSLFVYMSFVLLCVKMSLSTDAKLGNS